MKYDYLAEMAKRRSDWAGSVKSAYRLFQANGQLSALAEGWASLKSDASELVVIALIATLALLILLL